MTIEQKDRIVSLRESGYSYAEISIRLKMSEQAIRTFCSRNGLTAKALSKAQTELPSNVCPFCGASIIQIPKQKPKRFCSEECRLNWWAKNKINSKREAFYKIRCKCCGKEFTSYGNKGRKYCSRECYFLSRFSDGGATAETGTVSV